MKFQPPGGTREAILAGRAPERRHRIPSRALWPAAAACLLFSGAMFAREPQDPDAPTLEETRLTLGKWIETQQILSKERNEWNEGKEILTGRLELIRKEISTLEEKLGEATASADAAERKRDEQGVENERIKAEAAHLAEAATLLETEIRRLLRSSPDPVQLKLQPLTDRLPEDAATTRASVAERFQNVLGILNELNKANTEIAVHFEVHELAGGNRSEVQAIYVGLAQAYFVSANGDAGIGHPTPEGWKWEPAPSAASDVLKALEILQGKHTPAFVPLPMKLQ